MRESGYYPAGAEFDPNAPYNQKDLPEITRTVKVSITVEKDCELTTDDYDFSDMETPDTSFTDWEDEYSKQCYPIPKLLDMLAEYVRKDMETLSKRSFRYRRLTWLLDDLQGWTVTNSEFDEE